MGEPADQRPEPGAACPYGGAPDAGWRLLYGGLAEGGRRLAGPANADREERPSLALQLGPACPGQGGRAQWPDSGPGGNPSH